ncbi:helicase-related protein [Actinomadura montaniterrae]|nr:helicase-related protein [Actinomadura montaniterrae]
MTATPWRDFRSTFATNHPEQGQTVADAINVLLAGMRQNLVEPPVIAIASAYFNPGGFMLLADELERAGSVRLLLGAEPEEPRQRERPLAEGVGRQASRVRIRQALEGHARALERERDLLGFTRTADSSARRLVRWLRSGRVQVRHYQAGFLHGKAFIVETAMPGVISGSSNFTFAGLSRNRELNLGQYQPDTVAAVREWFEEAWQAATPFDLAALYEARWNPHRPWDVFLRMLYELYGAEVEAESAARGGSQLGLTEFQTDGVWRAQRIMDRLNGVIVADEVGLGKTYIAGEILHEAVIINRQKALVVAPATLRDSTWRPFLREKNLPADVVSYDELVSGVADAGRVGSSLQPLDDYALVVIDEAHALRNASTRRAEALRGLTEGAVPKRLVLLTATPVNNSLYDLYNLISYFVTNDAAFADSGIPSLKGYFDRAMAVHPDELSPEHLFDVIDRVAVRRTRRFVRHHYSGDRVVINGVTRQISFPTPRVRRVDYDLEEALPGLFDQLATALGAHSDDDPESAVNLTAPSEVLSLARYVPSRFRLDSDTEEQFEQQNAGLLRSALLKRFESSAYAFQRTVEKMIASHEQFLSALEHGKVLTGDALREWSASDSDEMDAFLEALQDETLAGVQDAADYDVTALRRAIQADRDLLKSFHLQVQQHHASADTKIIALIEELASITQQAAEEAITEDDERDKRKILVFSYYSDTVEHIHGQLQTAIETDPRLACYRSRLATASGPDGHGRAEVIAGFAPRTAGGDGEEDRYDLIIATDVLAEGVNLQQARHIINYDLPWNPMRLVQRHGRIDRIGSHHREVYLRCFFPDRHLESLLGLEDKLQRKLKQAAAATGVGEVLPGYTGRDVSITETRTEIDRLRREDATLLEEGGASALSGEEYRRQLAANLNNPLTRRTVLELAWGSGSGFVRTGVQPGLVFCARIGDHPKPWFRYVPLTPDLTIEPDDDGSPIVIDDTLACLTAADPGGPDTPAEFPDAVYQAAINAWTVAKAHIVDAWTHNTDPANLQRPVPKVMRDAAELVRQHGAHLGDQQDELVERLQAPYSPRILRTVRATMNQLGSPRDRVDQVADLADRLGLVHQHAPHPLPPITSDDVHLVCWVAITPRLGPLDAQSET